MKFLSSGVALCHYKSTISPCMEYCCHIWPGDPSYFLNMVDKLQKRVCSSVGSTLAAFLKPLTHCKNEPSLSHFHRYYFIRCSSELAELVPLPYSRDRFTRYSDFSHDFSITIPRFYIRCQCQRFFHQTAGLWNSCLLNTFL